MKTTVTPRPAATHTISMNQSAHINHRCALQEYKVSVSADYAVITLNRLFFTGNSVQTFF